MFDREKAIDELANALNDEFNQGYLSFDDIVINGFRGLSSMTDEELMAELEARDISYLFGETHE
jgi:hypothetical protein